MISDLRKLIAHAAALGGHPCADGHEWRAVGGRVCSRHDEPCTETVYQCARCDEVDYEHRECEGIQR